MKHTKYNRQVVFYFLDDRQYLDAIVAKANKQYIFEEPTKIVMLTLDAAGKLNCNTQELLNACASIDNKTRIYIVGHCGAGAKKLTLSDDKERGVTAKELALLIVSAIPRDSAVPKPLSIFQSHSEQKLKISLAACAAGMFDPHHVTPPNHINNSFAAQLLYEFKMCGVECVIAARLQRVGIGTLATNPRIYVEKPLVTEQMDMLQKQLIAARANNDISAIDSVQKKMLLITYNPRQNEAKVLYQYVDGHQTISTAYLSKPGEPKPWRADVFDTINRLIIQTDSSEKKLTLCQLLNNIFFFHEDRGIYYQLSKAKNSNWEKDSFYKLMHHRRFCCKPEPTTIFLELDALLQRYSQSA